MKKSKLKEFWETNKTGLIGFGTILISAYAMSYFGAKRAIRKTNFEIHLFDSDGRHLGVAD